MTLPAPDPAQIDEANAICPACDKPVAYKWVRNGGFLPEPHNVLIADSVFHAECWEIEEENIQCLSK